MEMQKCIDDGTFNYETCALDESESDSSSDDDLDLIDSLERHKSTLTTIYKQRKYISHWNAVIIIDVYCNNRLYQINNHRQQHLEILKQQLSHWRNCHIKYINTVCLIH